MLYSFIPAPRSNVMTDPVILTRAQVIARLKRGESCRTGWTFNYKAFFSDDAEAPDRVMRRLAKDGALLIDNNGNITLDPEWENK
jgi:hypothetical protein